MKELFNLEAELSVLGALIRNNSFIDSVTDILRPHHFYEPLHQELYEFIFKTHNESAVDAVTVLQFAKTKEVKEYLVKTVLSYSSPMLPPREYARILVELWSKREAKFLCEQTLEKLPEGKIDFLVSDLTNKLLSLDTEQNVKKTVKLSDVGALIVKDRELGIKPKIIATNLKELDLKLNGGFYSKRLYVFAATAGAGKTSLALQTLLTAAKNKHNCLFFSMEMDEREIYFKAISFYSSVPSWKYQKDCNLSQYEFEATQTAATIIDGYHIYINGTDRMGADTIHSLLKKQIAQTPVDLVVLDYVQIMETEESKNKNLADLIKRNTTALKSLAKKYDVAVIALSQIKRNDNKEPTLEDLKGSGGIGEDADMVIALHTAKMEEQLRRVKTKVLKNRWGSLGEFDLNFQSEFGRFSDLIDNNNNF